MHLNEEQVQRFLHGELDEREQEALAAHLADCTDCARQLEEAEREEIAVFDLLRHVDHAAPVIEAQALVPDRSGTYARWGRRAAGVLIAAALGGAAYAFPGSPLPALLNHVAAWITGQATPPPAPSPAPSPSEPSPAPRPETAGIAVPVRERFSIHFAAAQDSGDVAVSLADGPNVVAHVFSGTATFTTDVDRLTIENSGSAADYEIELPRHAVWVEVYAGDRRLLLKDGDSIVAAVEADSLGRYVLPLSPPDPSSN